MHVLLKKLMRYADFHFRINFNKFTSIGTRNELNVISIFNFIQIILFLFDYKLNSDISLLFSHHCPYFLVIGNRCQTRATKMMHVDAKACILVGAAHIRLIIFNFH